MTVSRPLVSIVGTTGVGKSRLAIDLALSLLSKSREHPWQTAKVINSDAMQVYAGADVITNKVSESEKRGVGHLLMGFKEPGDQYVVGQWVNDAIREIDKLHRQKELPIVVGGTAYWMQHLIFPNRLPSIEDTAASQDSGGGAAHPHSEAFQKALASLSQPLFDLLMNLPENPSVDQAFTLHNLLTQLDPQMASRWHWKDTRKVVRSLEIIRDRGCLASEIMAQQTTLAETSRYPTLIFWLFSESALLQQRLDARVDEMMRHGLLEDVKMLRGKALSEGASEAHSTSGIFQSIGYKEFSGYLSSASPTQKDYDDAVERTKISNRQYARRQVQWIRNKLLPAVNAAAHNGSILPVYLLEVGELDKWDTEVRDKAVHILNAFLGGRDLPNPKSLSVTANSMLDDQLIITDPTATLAARQKIICKVCTTHPDQPVMIEEAIEWHAHIKSRKHRRLQRKQDHLNNLALQPAKPTKQNSNPDSDSKSSPSPDFEYYLSIS